MAAETATLFSFWWLVGCTILCALAFAIPAKGIEAACLRLRLPLPMLVVMLALAVRLVPAVAFKLAPGALVNFDIDSYRIVGNLLRSGQDVYSEPARYPYLPFQMYFSAAASWLASHNAGPFDLLVKLPQILADAAIPALLLTFRGKGVTRERAVGAAAIYAVNPLSTLVVSVHGQFDSIPAFFALLAVWTVTRRRASLLTALMAGAALGLGILAKSWPVILVPIVAWQLPAWRERAMTAAMAAAIPLAGLLTYAVALGVSLRPALDAVRTYSGFRGAWGYPLLLNKAVAHNLVVSSDFRDWTDLHRIAILAGSIAVATLLVLRREAVFAATVAIFAFYVMTPGWGYHYLVWALPFVLIGTARPLAAAYLGLATATVFTIFYWFGGVYFGVFNYFSAGDWIVRWSWATPIPIWVYCVAMLASLLFEAQAWREPREWLRRSYWQARRPETSPAG